MRKYKKYTREECSKKFDDLMMNTFNYVMQEGEQIVQCKEPYPAYWFMSNKGYLFSAYGNKIRIRTAAGRDRTGIMNTKLKDRNTISTLACTG